MKTIQRIKPRSTCKWTEEKLFIAVCQNQRSFVNLNTQSYEEYPGMITLMTEVRDIQITTRILQMVHADINDLIWTIWSCCNNMQTLE